MVSHLVTLWKVTFRFLSKRSLLIRWHCRYLLLGRWGIPCPTWCQAISNWQKKKWTLHAIYINIPTESNVPFTSIYPLVMTNIAMEAMALIEIDGLPFLIAWWIFPWRTVSHNQMVVPKQERRTEHFSTHSSEVCNSSTWPWSWLGSRITESTRSDSTKEYNQIPKKLKPRCPWIGVWDIIII